MNLPRTNKEASVVIPPDSPKAVAIYDTLKPLEGILDPEESLLLGSAAAFLYGIELNTYDPLLGRSHERPQDIDFGSTASQMERIYKQGLGTPKDVYRKGQTILQIQQPSSPMPVDLITRFRDGRDDMLGYDNRFRARLARNSRPLDGSPFRIASPELLHRELRANRIDLKAAQDLESFYRRFPTRRSRSS